MSRRFVIAYSVLGILIALNFVLPRDGFFTADVENYDPGAVRTSKVHDESAIQVLYTYGRSSSTLAYFGSPGEGGFTWSGRLAYKWPLLEEEEILDLREQFSPAQVLALRGDMARAGFSSNTACPHDYSVTCRVGVNWNRELAQVEPLFFVAFRYDETDYAIVDLSFFE